MLQITQNINQKIDPNELKLEMQAQLKVLEYKMTTFLAKVFDLNELGMESNRNGGVSMLDEAIQKAAKESKARKEYDIEGLPVYLAEMKAESKNDLIQFKTISEVEEYVYQVLHKNRNLKDRKDASLEDLMAVTNTEHSQDLTNRIRQLIYMDHQANRGRGGMGHDGESIISSDRMPSIIKESQTFAKMFFKQGDESTESFDPKKVKKIEFSQSIHKDKSEKSLLWTHSKIDDIVFQGSMKNREFDINDAKKLLKQVVSQKGRKASIQSDQSFEFPAYDGDYTQRQHLESLPSTIDDHFANVQVEEPQKNNKPKKKNSDQPQKENLQETVKRLQPLPAGGVQTSNAYGSQSQKATPMKPVPPLSLHQRQDHSANLSQGVMRRDQSQNSLMRNPSQISLAPKLKARGPQLEKAQSPNDTNVQDSSQDHLKNLQQQFYQILQQQKQVDLKKNPFKQQPNEIDNLLKKLNDKTATNHNRSVNEQQHNSSVQDEEAVVLKPKRASSKGNSGEQTTKKTKKKTPYAQLQPPQQQQSMNRKGSLPKINSSGAGGPSNMSFVQEMAAYSNNNQAPFQNKIHSKKTSQSVLYTNNYQAVNQSQYSQHQQPQQQQQKQSDGMKRSKSSAGFLNNGSQGNTAKKTRLPQTSASNGYPQQGVQPRMQKSQSSKKYQNLSDAKNYASAGGQQQIKQREMSFKRLIVLD